MLSHFNAFSGVMLLNCCLTKLASAALEPVNTDAFTAAPMRNSLLNASLRVGAAKPIRVTARKAAIASQKSLNFIFISCVSQPGLRRLKPALSEFVGHLNGGLFV